MNSKALVTVTGASGFIALRTIKKLLEQGYDVRGTLRNPARAQSLTNALAERVDVAGLSFVTADLSADEGWDTAMEGAQYLLHMASPLPVIEPKDERDLISPARDGALRAVKAAAAAGIRRIVMTSSIAAVYGGHDKSKPLDETCWSDINAPIGAYPKSKTIAEKAVWDYLASLSAESRPQLAVINPGFVLGPVLDHDISASHEVVRRLLAREVPGIPDISFNLVDVRDVAKAHISAMEKPDAAEKRFICVTDRMSLRQIARELDLYLAPRGYKIPTQPVPDWLVRLLALFSPSLKVAAARLGPAHQYNTHQIRNTLAWQPISVRQSVIETAESLIANDLIHPDRPQ
ncbi:MAG: NAD-dependent epimerase/dehydratase family protein [Alphaproteobacteria bacterium]|nr:MAG: NAD-dependent epimerase/dehydratase family protein [Alphaproteobacteria bacterium]